VSDGDRRRLLAGLGPEGRRVAARLIAEYGPWDAASLMTLRQYAVSVDRLQGGGLSDAERRREVRVNLLLLRALSLER